MGLWYGFALCRHGLSAPLSPGTAAQHSPYCSYAFSPLQGPDGDYDAVALASWLPRLAEASGLRFPKRFTTSPPEDCRVMRSGVSAGMGELVRGVAAASERPPADVLRAFRGRRAALHGASCLPCRCRRIPATVAPGAAYVTDSAGHVSVLSASTGTLLATYNATTAPPSWAAFPASKDGSVVYYVSKGEISALTLRLPPTPSPLPPPVPTPAPTSPSTASVVESRCLHLNCTACTVVTSPAGCRSLPSAKRSVRYSCLAGDLLEVSTFDSSTTCTGIPTRTSVFPPDVCNLEAAGSFTVRRCH